MPALPLIDFIGGGKGGKVGRANKGETNIN